jgi:hypothetical protein
MTLYVARLLDLPPLTAAAAFQAVLADLQLRAGAVRLELTSVSAVDRQSPVSPYCVAPGRLRFPGRSRGVTVEVEVGVWSNRAVELGVRPVGRTGHVERYADAGHAVLAVLASKMHAWLDTEMEAAVEAVFVHPALKGRSRTTCAESDNRPDRNAQ